PFSVATWLA
ncbi:hypothetical protein D018_1482B, partial [Vibrio parahaemolyticus VP2007-007]